MGREGEGEEKKEGGEERDDATEESPTMVGEGVGPVRGLPVLAEELVYL